MEETDQRKVRVIFSGRVQGVGFRINVQQLAERFPVVGMVRNVSDGSVELIAVGETNSLMNFLNAIHQRMSRNIVDCKVEWLDAVGQKFEGFSIEADKIVAPKRG